MMTEICLELYPVGTWVLIKIREPPLWKVNRAFACSSLDMARCIQETVSCFRFSFPPPLARATLKFQNLTETTPPDVLTRALFVRAVGKHKR